ncbi:predicted protein [Lichtheimia corymbifera JMRC:FSU:9682]|uniref:Fanconi Anaemia group E protein C-terminal domain-containing protein n=1 Tax=Lichtheimia corymbifera JMRC:FSU:9682 TaxID=1263082 RepID=A0A068RW71_9FUNG|nr:predicted protein [Lichtheimia corymbifera JMRC:FSU:9682]
MPGFSRHNDFAFSSTLINAFDPCSTISRKRQWQLNTNDLEFVPVKIKRRQHQHPPTPTTSTSQDQQKLNAQGDPTTGAVEKAVDYSALLRELEPLSGEPLFELLVTLPLPQVDYVCQQRKGTWSQEHIMDLCHAISNNTSSLSSMACISALVRHVVIPNVDSLQKRVFLTSVTEHIPERSLLDGLVIPMLPELTRPRVQILLKLPLTPTSRASLLRAVCTNASLKPWSDALLQFIERTLSQQPLLTTGITSDVATTLVNEANLQILLVLTSKYGQLLVNQQLLNVVEAKAQASQQVLKRAVLGQVTSIRKRLGI